MGNLGQPDFRVSHGSGTVTVDRAEVTLTIHEHVAQRKVLRHADNRVVYSLVAVRMVFTNHVTDDTSRFLVCPVPVVVELVHGKEHTSMHRFQAIPNIRQCPPNDHAHGVIEIAAAHFVFEGDR